MQRDIPKYGIWYIIADDDKKCKVLVLGPEDFIYLFFHSSFILKSSALCQFFKAWVWHHLETFYREYLTSSAEKQTTCSHEGG